MIRTGGKGVHYELLAEFRYEIRRFLTFSEQAARAEGIEPQQHQALLAIKGLPRNRRATIATLAQRLQIRHHSAVGLINRMESKGLIRRICCPDDHREMMLRLTARGERLLQGLSHLHRAELQSAGPALLRALLAVIPDAEVAGKPVKKSSLKRQLPLAPTKARRSEVSPERIKR
jgi:DNA-binding MarR family transcriptional regulator